MKKFNPYLRLLNGKTVWVVSPVTATGHVAVQSLDHKQTSLALKKELSQNRGQGGKFQSAK